MRRRRWHCLAAILAFLAMHSPKPHIECPNDGGFVHTQYCRIVK